MQTHEQTISDLNKELVKQLEARGLIVENVRAFVSDYLQSLGASSAAEYLLDAEVNEIERSIARLQDKIATDLKKWVDTRLQGDLFHDIRFRCPSLIKVDGRPVSCYDASLLQIGEYMEHIVGLRVMSADAAQRIADLKQQYADSGKTELAAVRRAIESCRAQGIDPSTVHVTRDE